MSVTAVGVLLREWRAARRLSQLELSLATGISARHISYVETGKANPSRDLVSRLADSLEMPLRERNALLMAAGFAPRYAATSLATPALSAARRAIDSILTQQEPYPAYLLNRRWDVLAANRAATRLTDFLLDGTADPHDNMIRQFFDPRSLRSVISNWEEVARDLIRHLHIEVAALPSDEIARALLEEVLAYPGVPNSWRLRDVGASPTPLLTTLFEKEGRQLRFFSTITTFGTPYDVTLDELRIECVFPEDEPTAAFCRELREAAAG